MKSGGTAAERDGNTKVSPYFIYSCLCRGWGGGNFTKFSVGGQIISGTKCDRDKQISSAERVGE